MERLFAPRTTVATNADDQHIQHLRAQADLLTAQLQLHEAYRMSQTVENLGGPGSMRARYMRAIMTTPYAVNPLLPFMQHSPGQAPPGYGAVHTMPSELDMRAGEPDTEMTALEQGITHTAAANAAAMGRILAEKIAEEYGNMPQADYAQQYVEQPRYQQPYYAQEVPPQYTRAAQQVPSSGSPSAVGHHLAGAVKGLGTVLGESAMATGHALSAVGKGVGHVAGGFRDFMSQDSSGGQRWGTGVPPAAMTNEYGQPIYG